MNRTSSIRSRSPKRTRDATLVYRSTKRARTTATSVPTSTASAIPTVATTQLERPLLPPSIPVRIDHLETRVRNLESDLTETRAALSFLIDWVKNSGGDVPDEICRLSVIQPRRRDDDDGDADNAGNRSDSRPVADKGKGVEIQGETGEDTTQVGTSGADVGTSRAGTSGAPHDDAFNLGNS